MALRLFEFGIRDMGGVLRAIYGKENIQGGAKKHQFKGRIMVWDEGAKSVSKDVF